LQSDSEKRPKVTVATNTDNSIADTRQDMKAMKENWLLGHKTGERPAIPERPIGLRTSVRALRSAFDPSKNYENVSMSSNENLSGDERTLQRTQV